jgi:putrescine transport system substrate-binding protein
MGSISDSSFLQPAAAGLSRRAFGAGLTAALTGCARPAAQQTVNVYSWTDYIAPDTVSKFEAATGVKVRYDVYDSVDTLEAKLMAGGAGYDVVVPSAMPHFARQIRAGRYRKLDKALIPNLKGLDPAVMAMLRAADPDNAYGAPYLMSATGIGFNRKKVAEAAPGAELDSLGLLFDPKLLARLKSCGVTLLDDPVETLPAALAYVGKDPRSLDPADLARAGEVARAARPSWKYIHSSSYINDLASGDICVAQGYIGDLVQARTRAREAGQGVEIEIVLPKQGSSFNIDCMAVPADAPSSENAFKFINFILDPKIIGAITDAVGYANAVPASKPYVKAAITGDPAIYPPAGTRTYLPPLPSADYDRSRNRLWTEIRAGG